MLFEELTVLAAGYWLAESQNHGEVRRMDWERAAGVFQDTADLAWQLLLLVGLGWALQALSLPLPGLAGLGLTVVSAYGLSLLRRRPEEAAEPYFLALGVLALAAQHGIAASGGMQAWGMLARILGGTLACEVVLLGLKDRLRWSPVFKAVHGTPQAFLCLALLAVILWSMGF